MADTPYIDALHRLSGAELARLDRVLFAAKGGQRAFDHLDTLWALSVPGYREAVYPPCAVCGSPELHDQPDVCPVYEAWRVR